MRRIATALLVLTTAVCFAQTITSAMRIENLGGWPGTVPLSIGVGVEQGDRITLHVTCDNGQQRCLFEGPLLLNGQAFKLVRERSSQDQTYRVVVGNTGPQTVYAIYYPGIAHYSILITAKHGQ